MSQLIYQFNCPECGVVLPYVLKKADVADDSQFTIICGRFTKPPGCGAEITLKPSSGMQIGRIPEPGPVTASDPWS
jgi:hypothetical protein